MTTMLAGNCGFTLAPINEHEADYLVRMLAIVEGMPLDALQAGVACTWTSTGEYLDHVDRGLAVNAGFMVGHSALRRVVMREEATKRTATPAEIEIMVQMLRAGLSAGGWVSLRSYGSRTRCQRLSGAVAVRTNGRARHARTAMPRLRGHIARVPSEVRDRFDPDKWRC